MVNETVGLLSEATETLLGKFGATGTKVITPLFFGQFLSWSRETEFTADRAGLLCCQDIDVAIEALFRLQHGIRKGSRYYDASKKIDVESELRELDYWENRPFVDVLRHLNKSTHPFIEQRMAVLKKWHDSSMMDDILDRGELAANDQLLLTIDRVGVASFSPPEGPLAVYLVAFVGDTKWFQSPTQSNRSSAIWNGFPTSMKMRAGQPVFFELWEDRVLADKLVGMFVVYPKSGQTNYQAPFRLDIEQRQSVDLPAKALVKASAGSLQ